MGKWHELQLDFDVSAHKKASFPQIEIDGVWVTFLHWQMLNWAEEQLGQLVFCNEGRPERVR